jgi:peptide-methionine (S)-S-oxide reductase
MASAPKTLEMPTVDTALPGRAQAIPTARPTSSTAIR